jgi:hypothetical protein
MKNAAKLRTCRNRRLTLEKHYSMKSFKIQWRVKRKHVSLGYLHDLTIFTMHRWKEKLQARSINMLVSDDLPTCL